MGCLLVLQMYTAFCAIRDSKAESNARQQMNLPFNILQLFENTLLTLEVGLLVQIDTSDIWIYLNVHLLPCYIGGSLFY
jgi:hypothetical protein